MVRRFLDYRKKYQGFWEVNVKVPIKDSYSLSLAYTPGVGRCCTEIKDNVKKSFELTNRANSIAIITDASTFADYETINPLCAIPLAESKAILYKEFAGIDAYPIVVNTRDVNEIANVVLKLAPSFAGFDLNEILPERSATLQNLIEKRLKLPVIYGYKEPDVYTILQKLDLLDKIDPAVILPAVFRAALDVKASYISDEMYEAIEAALVDAKKKGLINNCSKIELNLKIAPKIAYFVAKKAIEIKVATEKKILPEDVEESYYDYLFEGTKSQYKTSAKNYLSKDFTLEENSVELHRKICGVIGTASKINLKDIREYTNFYSSDKIQQVTKEIELDFRKAYTLTPKGNLVAVISDGSAVLGYGNIGAEAGLPVMEGKSALFKTLAGVDAVPICLKTQDTNEIIEVISSITPIFGGINLEDISAPRCFEIEKRLIEKLNIPVFHDDQHGTAVVVLAGFLNAIKLTGKKIEDVNVVINGAGAAALSVANIILQRGVRNLIICDLAGAVYEGRTEEMDDYKRQISLKTNLSKKQGNLADIIKGADFFIGLSAGGTLKPEMVKSMAENPVIFALANPIPEIMPELAYEAGAFIVATGRSDYKNQVNNSLAFPGIFRGALDVRAKRINTEMKLAAAEAIASLVSEDELKPNCIIPHALDLKVSPTVATAVAQSAIDTGVAQIAVKSDLINERTKNFLYEGFLKANLD